MHVYSTYKDWDLKTTDIFCVCKLEEQQALFFVVYYV